ncbi:hypothetical protein [Amylibacter sp. IMCC11727]|uniref:hypothetical protein n=1 Tax=Amylibacter sp. IMCC11727 TaxID=3039851 RepID=UPI00244E2792|nr:hypothetical protein [Amylibacter sp. IMCC11727]WGI22110.1 hypothetical protein QBD29_01435 [Amylibacter sp. IMCC11727]
MGFPYDKADWSVVDGAMFIGWGSSMPGLYTAIAAAICVAVLVIGHGKEAKKAKKFDK